MKAKIYFFLAILFIATSCSSVSLTGSWIIPDAKPVEGKTIAIFCVTPRLNVDKFAYEFANVIVKDLVSKGVLAEAKK